MKIKQKDQHVLQKPPSVHHMSLGAPPGSLGLGDLRWLPCRSLRPLSPPPAARSEEPAASAPCSPWLPAGARTPGPAQRGAGGGSGTAREGPGPPTSQLSVVLRARSASSCHLSQPWALSERTLSMASPHPLPCASP